MIKAIRQESSYGSPSLLSTESTYFGCLPCMAARDYIPVTTNYHYDVSLQLLLNKTKGFWKRNYQALINGRGKRKVGNGPWIITK